MHQPAHAFFCCNLGDPFGGHGVHLVKGIFANRQQHTHAVHNRIGTLHRRPHRRVIANVAQDWFDLTHRTIRLYIKRLIGATHGDPHPPALLGHTTRHITPHKTGSAINGH